MKNEFVDAQHAVIEYFEDESCYVIQDLNSTNGTFINDCRVQNAAVRLAENDVIRFGYCGIRFNFLVNNSQFVVCLFFNGFKKIYLRLILFTQMMIVDYAFDQSEKRSSYSKYQQSNE